MPDDQHKHALGDTMHGLVASVKKIEEGLLGCVESGESGLIARVENLEKKVDEVLERRKFREQTVFAAAIGAVITAVVALWAALWSKGP